MKQIIKKVLLNPVVKKQFRKVAEFYDNQPVENLHKDFKTDVWTKETVFHVGSVMPFPDNDALALREVVGMALKENITVAEVGSWTGKSTAVIAKAVLPVHGRVYAVDHWRGSIDVWQYDIAKQYNIFEIFRRNMEILGVAHIVHPLVMDSNSASRIIQNGSLDLVFIDGDHRYTPVKNDIQKWLPKLKPGGILSGHDCSGYYSRFSAEVQKTINENREQDDIPGVGHPGVIRALYDCFKDRHSIMPNSVVWFIKH